ncbi:MAG TPA: M3 family oligoendopeptidase [Gemmatimonadales bacterium]|nr:M3 family oligoendopeptidase [Gemmatimonadales bacterium]
MVKPFVLPASAAAFAQASWADIAPFYGELAARPISLDTVEAWLADWSRLEELLSEAAARAMIAYTVETEDPKREADHLRFSTEVLPRADEESVGLAKRLLELGYTRADLASMVERFRTQIEIFREENVPLSAQLEELGARYQKITGGMMVQWEGREVTLPQLQPHLRSRDRLVRERAFRLMAQPFRDQHQELASLFSRMYHLRQRTAENAGFTNYRDYAFRAKFRFDYTPEDVDRFHQAVEEVVSPAVERLRKKRRERLQLPTLRPWDTQVDPRGKAALQPFRDVRDLETATQRVMQRLDPVLGRQFEIMMNEKLLDLGTRKGKAPGGYCETLHESGRPFIFMNAAGTFDDVMTLCHEAGHAFHAFAAHPLRFIWQRHPGMEAAELASMSMELLAARYMGRDDGGFFSPEEMARARVEHLEDILVSLIHIASVDAFQTWIYTSGEGGDALARDRAWLDIRSRFERGLDWSGLEPERVGRWYRQLHIFLYPFYYIEYGIAQLGALQVWRNSLKDERASLDAYRAALALGATVPLPQIYGAAGAQLIFDPGPMAELVGLVEEHIDAAELSGQAKDAGVSKAG